MPLSATEREPARAPAQAAARVPALDWTKGALIICMVIYHAINYSAFRPLAFRWLAFLPPSFILITGFLVGQVYAAKYDLRTWKPYARLAIRGMKLLLVFVFLNVVHCVALKRGLQEGLWEFADRSDAIFVSGNGRAGIFEVLLPIAYFLLLAPALLWLRARSRGSITVCAAAMFLLCVGLELGGRQLKNLSFVSVGLIGMALGLIRLETVDRLAWKWLPVLALYLLYRLAGYLIGEVYPVQTAAAAVSVLLLYCCALHLGAGTWLGRQIVLLGQYSLLGYLAQIVVIQFLVMALGGQPDHAAGVIVVCLATAALTLLIIRTVHESRRKSRFADVAYKTVFA
jgi:fucose 4-O-acetylase-like acetyltransferase